jgi:hypothetical protein
MKTILMMMALVGTAQADIVTVYQCESRCVAVDFKGNIFQVLGVKQSGLHLQLQDAWMQLNEKCEKAGNRLSWSRSTTSFLLVKNSVFGKPLILDMVTKMNACKELQVNEYDVVPVYEGDLRVGG